MSRFIVRLSVLGKVAENFITMSASVIGSVCSVFSLMGSSVFGGLRPFGLKVIEIALAIVIPLSIWLFAQVSFGVRDHAKPSTVSLSAELFTRSAFSLTTSACRDTDIFWREFVTSNAVHFGGWTGSSNVLGKRTRFKVLRIYTFRHSAKMIKGQAVWYWSVSQFKRKAVCHMASSLVGQMPIAGLINGPDPKPASGSFQNSGIKGLFDGTRAHYVQYAPTSRLAGSLNSLFGTTSFCV